MRSLLFAVLVSAAGLTTAACDSAGPAGPAAGPNAIEMKVNTTPPGATLVIDGTPAGTTPVTLKLNPGPHRAHASMNGYYPPPEARFQVGATEPREITIALVASH